MESKDREFQKAIIRILILMVTGMIVWNLAVSVTNRRIAAIYYERISAILVQFLPGIRIWSMETGCSI